MMGCMNECTGPEFDLEPSKSWSPDFAAFAQVMQNRPMGASHCILLASELLNLTKNAGFIDIQDTEITCG